MVSAPETRRNRLGEALRTRAARQFADSLKKVPARAAPDDEKIRPLAPYRHTKDLPGTDVQSTRDARESDASCRCPVSPAQSTFPLRRYPRRRSARAPRYG